MNARPALSTLALLLALSSAACSGDAPAPGASAEATDTPASQETKAPAPDVPALPPADTEPAVPEAAAPADPASVVAKVGTREITEGELLARLGEIVASQMRGRPLPPAQMQQLRATMGPQVLESLIDEALLDSEVAEAGIAPSGDEYRDELRGQVEAWIAFEGMSADEFEVQIEAKDGVTYDEFIEKTAADEAFRRNVRHVLWLTQEYAERVAVSDEEVRARYDEQLEEVWSRPALVRASHILFELPGDDPEAAAAKRQEAERVLALARAEGADFAELAREYSEGPSGPDGGELGYFPREGAMVEPFAAAAFELQVGEVSDLVETQFGLHVIRVTDRTEAHVVPFEEAVAPIRRQLEALRVAEVRPERLEKLRAGAEIEYL